MKKISIISNIDKDRDFKALYSVAEILGSLGAEVFVDRTLGTENKDNIIFTDKESLTKTDLIVVLGGDGTILDIAKEAAVNKTPILGINLGNLGFLSQAEAVSRDIFEDIFSGNYTITENMMLSAAVVENGKAVATYTALNDAVVKGEFSRMLNVKVDIDGVNTNNYPADGVILATATGSTAYSLSAGGAILHPELDTIMITPICPHTLKARCMIVPGGKKVEVSFLPPRRNDAVLMIDGKLSFHLEENQHVEVKRSEHRVKFINLGRRNFYDIVREKIADRSI